MFCEIFKESSKGCVNPKVGDVSLLVSISAIMLPLFFGGSGGNFVLSNLLIFLKHSIAMGCIPQLGIETYRFFDVYPDTSPQYRALLHHASHNCNILDLGSGFGAHLRKLHYHGAIPGSLYALDTIPSCLLGHALYKDHENFHCESAIFEPGFQHIAPRRWNKKFTVINPSFFLHQFDWKLQTDLCCNMVTLLRRSMLDTIVGRIIGVKVGKKKENSDRIGGGHKIIHVYKHNEPSFLDM